MSSVSLRSPHSHAGWDQHPVRRDIIDAADDCRVLATEFTEQAEREPERKAHLLEMAASWLDIADRADHIQSLMERERYAVP